MPIVNVDGNRLSERDLSALGAVEQVSFTMRHPDGPLLRWKYMNQEETLKKLIDEEFWVEE
ncbi:MAG: hypothetical protein GC131_02690 [Alphaproteobacteria bacterium]|nr:hypothetical protein [Alphaproteobacteria bacterium]